MFKQDLAMAYFPDRSKEIAGKLLAREIHTNRPLMSALQSTNNPERELSTAELNQMKRRTPPQRKLLSPKQIQIIFSFLGEP